MPQYFGKLPTNAQPWTGVGTLKAVERPVDRPIDQPIDQPEQTPNALQKTGNDRHLSLHYENALVQISALSPRLMRVRFAPGGELLPRRSWAVTRDDDQWQDFPLTVEETEGAIAIQTDLIRLQIQRDSCQICCFDATGQPFAEDAEMGMGWRIGEVAAWKRIAAEEHFYGFGERTGLLDKRSQVETNWTMDALDYSSITDEMYQAIPFFMALRPGLAYGIFLNSTAWSQFDLGVAETGVWQMRSHSTELDYYIIYGPTPADILHTYTELTGRMPLPPRWALGYHQCRWSYESEDIVRSIAREFRDRQIPCDVIHLDIDYMQGYRVFTWSPRRFPDPTRLIADLKQAGFKVVTIVDPGVKYEPDGDYAVYHEGLQKECFVRTAQGALTYGYVWPNKAVFPDFIRPEVRQWWGEWHRALTDAGVAGIWNDMNEPAMDDRPFGDAGEKIWFPLDAPQGPAEEGGTHAETHNLYGLAMARAAAEAMEQLRSPERSFILTRSGFAGIQRWSAVWTGDNHSQWEHLEMSLPMLCNLGLSGVALVGADIGGFAGNATAELFARWMQVGLLYPFMRGHSSLGSTHHEPWVFGDRTEQICRDFINLRYQLIPYLYTLMWQASTSGTPALRPLLYHYPNDPKTYNLHDQVLLGEALMAAPVYRPGVEYRAVYLPEGIWYDWWTGDRYSGNTTILAHAPLERMPLYVKAGSIIPMQPVSQFIADSPADSLRLKLWQGDGVFTLYEDDGHSFAYRQGVYSTTTFRISGTADTMRVEVGDRQGQWSPPRREVILEWVGVTEHRYTDDGQARQVEMSRF